MEYIEDLDNLRTEIESIDKEMACLFEKRMRICKKIALLKKQNDIPVENLSREKQLFEKNVLQIEDEELKDYYYDFFKSIVNLSKTYQMTFTDEE